MLLTTILEENFMFIERLNQSQKKELVELVARELYKEGGMIPADAKYVLLNREDNFQDALKIFWNDGKEEIVIDDMEISYNTKAFKTTDSNLVIKFLTKKFSEYPEFYYLERKKELDLEYHTMQISRREYVISILELKQEIEDLKEYANEEQFFM